MIMEQNDIETINETYVAVSEQPIKKTRRDILLFIEDQIKKMPEAYIGDSPNCPLKHEFTDGIYVREMFIPAGTYISGEIHKFEHFVELLEGEIIVLTEHGYNQLKAPLRFKSKPGVKRVAFTIQDTKWSTIHSNRDNETDLKKLKEHHIAKDFIEYDKSVLKQNNNIISQQIENQ